MKHFYLITNQIKDPDLAVTENIQKELKERGAECGVHVMGNGGMHAGGYEIPEETECIMVLGGDGTLLEAARDTADLHIPLIGVNLGTLGYLSEVDKENLSEAIKRLCADDYFVEERMMLEGHVTTGSGEYRNDALNDIVISRSGSLQMLHFRIFVNGHFLRGYSADGMIVSTPTGSTGYNLSAGGPIVEPGAKLMMITPVCPHTLCSRSIVLSPEDEVEIEIGSAKDAREQHVEVNFDGARSVPLAAGDRVRIVRSEKTASIMKLSNVSFLEVLHRKMNDE